MNRTEVYFDMNEKKLRANIPKVLMLNMTWMALIVLPVLVPFFRKYGLSLEDVFKLQAIYAFVLILLDLPMGYVADIWGRKTCLVVASMINILAMTRLAYAHSFAGFAGFEILCGIGISLYSGADIALIYDSLALLGEKKINATAILGKRLFYLQIGEAVASVAGGIVAVYSLDLPAKINAIWAWIPFFIALTLHEPERVTLDSRTHWKNLKYIYNSIFRHSRLLTLVILNYIVYGFATLAAVWAHQAYWNHLDIPIQYFGYLWSAYNLLGAFVGRFAQRLEKIIGPFSILIIVGFLPIIGFAGMGFFGTFVGVLFGLSFPICRGLNQVLLQDAINSRVPSSLRATANSTASLGIRILFGFLGPSVGFMLDHQGFSRTFLWLSFTYVMAFLFFCIPLLMQRKNFRLSS
jgi:MFS family permease